MTKLSGQLTARLADKHEVYAKQLIDEINSRIKPPQPVTADDVHIRAMYIVSDMINSQGGKFEEPELDSLVSMMPDVPVLIGHKRDTLPVARNFHAVKINEGGRSWVKSYFYWLKASDGAEDLRRKVDGGIYKECSISFIFRLPQCSVCGEDIRRCSHIPFQEYEIGTGSSIAHFVYRQIERVLETSLVFRGAVPDTHITDKLGAAPLDDDMADTAETETVLYSKNGEVRDIGRNRVSFRDAPLSIVSFDSLPPSVPAICHVSPYQPGISVRIFKSNDEVDIETPILLSQQTHSHLVELVKKLNIKSCRFDAVMYAVRGKNRLDGFGLMRCLDRDESGHRLRLKTMDIVTLGDMSYRSVDYITRQRILRDNRSVFLRAGLDVVKPETIDRNDRLSVRLAGYRGQYRFGCELVYESDTDGLRRIICTDRKIVPAIVKGVFSGKESQAVCHVVSCSAASPANTVPVRARTHLNEGMVVLARVSGKSDRISSIFDILPGTSPELIDEYRTGPKQTGIRLLRDGKNLLLYFSIDDKTHQATIHHFNRQLFSRGRRFIADISIPEVEPVGCLGESVPVKSITETNGLYVFRLQRPAPGFGALSGLVLRPVLIDGVERYLCYAPEFNCLPEE